MRYLQILSPISFCLFLFGCGVTLQTNVISKDVRLRNFNKVYLVLATGAAGTSVNQANLGSVYGTASSSNSTVTAGGLGSNVGGTQVMSGQGQVNLALQDMAFELSQIGFEMVERADDAQTIAYFSIGTVRYDQLVGWIA
ncbi:MAG: hypothetical protein H8E17_12295, partial [Deltaproteobacteria bacterium]|nr:hypothetical protein [Deltaproteobacteria bacterium]